MNNKQKYLLMLTAAATLCAGHSVKASNLTGTVTSSVLNVRTEPSLSSSICGSLSKGDKVTVLGTEGNFYKISYKNSSAYASKDYIQLSVQTPNISTGKISAFALNVRSSPSSNSNVLGTLFNGNPVIIYGKEGNFYKISYDGKYGYVSADYVVSTSNSTVNSTPDSSVSKNTSNYSYNVTGKVTASALNIRNQASIYSDIIGNLHNGQLVTVLSKEGNFYKINYNGKNGYVSSDYINLISSTSGSSQNTNNTPSKENTSSNPTVNYNFTGYVTASSLNIRSSASTNSSIIGSLSSRQSVSVVNKEGNFYKINYNGRYGYVHCDYISQQKISEPSGSSENTSSNPTVNYNFTGYVTASSLNIRSSASTNSSIIGSLSSGQSVSVINKEGNFYKINYNGKSGYVSADYISKQKSSNSSSSNSKAEALKKVQQTNLISANISGNDLVSYAKTLKGIPYVWGGTTTSGFDCSGFVQFVYKHFGITLRRTTYEQVNQGQLVDKNNLKSGDLIFFNTNSSDDSDISHVGMSIGGTQFIEAGGNSVRISDLTSNYYNKAYFCAKRIIR